MTYSEEFKTVDLILDSGARTLGVGAFALSLIKAERQTRKLLTYLVYQSPAFGWTDIKELRRTLAANRCVGFGGVLAGLDALSPVPVRDLVGPQYGKLRPRFDEFKRHRNKIFHGQTTSDGLPRTYLIEAIADIKLWCQSLGETAGRELGYDGFGRNSFRKSPIPELSSRLRVQINSLNDYAAFISSHMQRSFDVAKRTAQGQQAKS